MKFDAYVQLKIDEIIQSPIPKNTSIFRLFYGEISNSNLIELFSILHAKINNLFSFINQKNTPGEGGHYNAADSRELIEVIDMIRNVQKTLQGKYSFDITPYYSKIIDQCKTFLVYYRGSSIPQDFPFIEIEESEPIFKLATTLTTVHDAERKTVKMRPIGKGSYATVYKFDDAYYGCSFAVKRANTNLRSDELERFKKEYNEMKKLDSPFIIKAYRYDNVKNEYVMELANETLDTFITRNNSRLPYAKRRSLVIQLFNAFEYIHSKRILHRDISYANILVKHHDDDSSWLKVSDFGLAKQPDSQLTRQGTEIKGSINDYNDLDKVGFENYEIRHETFALGKVIYFILTGRKGHYDREKNKELKYFVLKATSPNKRERFRDVEEMRQTFLNIVTPSIKSSLTQ